ncbi:uncharacterized protein TRIADDRAFT_56321 [Trichoplax adhaerens]|uniref:Iodothyronine deiodinase n=1 Tax=Trichoplax adhaerens TaxID=10228 RepID=B3RXT3_TRIAD|nr:hypothetical protein TRIADDRAFT_56321 [Trichoplax adhaerens]EDV24912.1 hypothetical protein TRIADDRAFT_56321 [Trichoplax adhaerens]|eukprot:XP_002112802.1 hypothetical protein TRIADDRAFT_56321 [Trichoplax adhaerens]
MGKKYADKAQFILIYIKEAHASDEWPLDYLNDSMDVSFKKPRVLEERMSLAKQFIDRFDIKLPVYVDDIKDTMAKEYSATPERLYVIRDGKISYKGGPGPMCYDLDELESHLQEL